MVAIDTFGLPGQWPLGSVEGESPTNTLNIAVITNKLGEQGAPGLLLPTPSAFATSTCASSALPQHILQHPIVGKRSPQTLTLYPFILASHPTCTKDLAPPHICW